MLQKILLKKPYMVWYIKDIKCLSDKSALEHILAYGGWEDVMEAEKTIGIKKMNVIFKEICSKKRSNLKPRTVNYFKNYLDEYA